LVKQIRVVTDGKVTGEAFEAYSWDDGRSFCSDPKATVAFLRRRKKVLSTTLSEREIRWIDQLNREPDDPVDTPSIHGAFRFRG